MAAQSPWGINSVLKCSEHDGGIQPSIWRLPRFASETEDAQLEDGQEEEGLLNEEQSLLVTSRLHQVLRPLMLRRLKQSVASELPSKVSHDSQQ